MTKSARAIAMSGAEKPYLIVDRQDLLSTALFDRLKQDATVVLVGGKEPQEQERLIYIPFKNRIPKIPDTMYECIYFVWDGRKDLLGVLPEFLKKVRADRTPFVFVVPYRYFQKDVVEKIISQHKRAYICVVGDIFGRDVAHVRQSEVDEYIYEAKTTGGILIPGIGLGKTYPVYFQDAVDAIISVVDDADAAGKIQCLFGRTPLTQLGLSRLLQRIDPFLHIDFAPDKEKNAAAPQPMPQGNLILDDTNIAIKLQDAYTATKLKLREKPYVPPATFSIPFEEPFIVKKKSSSRNPFLAGAGLFFFYCFLVFAIFPIGGTSTFSFLGTQALIAANNNLEKEAYANARLDAQISGVMFSNAAYFSTFVIPEAVLIRKENAAVQLSEKIDTGRQLSRTIQAVLDAAEIYKNIFQGKSVFPAADFQEASNFLQNAIVDFQSLRASNTVPVQYKDKIQSLNAPVEFLANTIDAFPQLLGMDKPKTYLILFQDNMELRPGGGSISSYGLLKINKGKIIGFTSHAVSDADGQLKGHVEPPFALRRYLPVPHLFLRDSNFDVDFAHGAPVIANLLAIESGQQVDGVIGVDASFVKAIIGATGFVFVPSYNETITEKNFFSLMEKHVQKSASIEVSQKGDFFRNVFTALQAKFASGRGISALSLLNNVTQAIREKHMLFAFADTGLQNLFTINGLSSSLWTVTDQADGINDFVGINEANIGSNEANYFLIRSLKEHVVIGDAGIITGLLQIDYKNRSQGAQWSGGDYKNYVRIVLPFGSVLTGITVNDERQNIVDAVTDPHLYEKESFIASQGLEVEQYEENGKTVYGFLVDVPAGNSRIVKVAYMLPQIMDLGKPIQNYSMEIFKQPGTDADHFDFSLQYPDALRVIHLSDSMVNNNNTLSSSMQLRTDKSLEVDFAKK